MPLIAWRKFRAGLGGQGTSKDQAAAITHITNTTLIQSLDPATFNVSSGHIDLSKVIAAWEIYDTTPTLTFTESDQTDPIGRFRFKGTGGGFLLEMAKTASWATVNTILSVANLDSGLPFVTLGSPNANNWRLMLGGGLSYTKNAQIILGTLSAGGADGIEIRTGDGTSSNDVRMLIGTGANSVPFYLAGITGITWSGMDDYREFNYRGSSTNTVVRVLDLTYNSSGGVGADGIGSGLGFRIETSTSDRILAGSIECLWTTATHASRKADMTFNIEDDFDGALEEYFRLDGSAKTILLNNNLDVNALVLKNVNNLELDEITTPTAVADHGKVYTKNTDLLYFQDGAGIEHTIAFV